jgi:two-component system phosphate regulon response regulator PhoB
MKRSDRVLVVEDDPNLLKMIMYNLEKKGYDVTGIADGSEASEKIREMTFDIAILDVMLPGVDGFRLCESIKKGPDDGKTIVVMLTARDQPLDRIYGGLRGADCYIVKPFDVKGLIEVVKGLIAKRDETFVPGACS